MENERQMNRLALQYMADLRSVPQTAGEVADYLGGRLACGRGRALELARRACDTLEVAGYLARCAAAAADEPLWKITADGLRQALRQVPPTKLDPLIWGGSHA
jgi:hypothetical protein